MNQPLKFANKALFQRELAATNQYLAYYTAHPRRRDLSTPPATYNHPSFRGNRHGMSAARKAKIAHDDQMMLERIAARTRQNNQPGAKSPRARPRSGSPRSRSRRSSRGSRGRSSSPRPLTARQSPRRANPAADAEAARITRANRELFQRILDAKGMDVQQFERDYARAHETAPRRDAPTPGVGVGFPAPPPSRPSSRASARSRPASARRQHAPAASARPTSAPAAHGGRRGRPGSPRGNRTLTAPESPRGGAGSAGHRPGWQTSVKRGETAEPVLVFQGDRSIKCDIPARGVMPDKPMVVSMRVEVWHAANPECRIMVHSLDRNAGIHSYATFADAYIESAVQHVTREAEEAGQEPPAANAIEQLVHNVLLQLLQVTAVTDEHDRISSWEIALAGVDTSADTLAVTAVDQQLVKSAGAGAGAAPAGGAGGRGAGGGTYVDGGSTGDEFIVGGGWSSGPPRDIVTYDQGAASRSRPKTSRGPSPDKRRGTGQEQDQGMYQDGNTGAGFLVGGGWAAPPPREQPTGRSSSPRPGRKRSKSPRARRSPRSPRSPRPRPSSPQAYRTQAVRSRSSSSSKTRAQTRTRTQTRSSRTTSRSSRRTTRSGRSSSRNSSTSTSNNWGAVVLHTRSPPRKAGSSDGKYAGEEEPDVGDDPEAEEALVMPFHRRGKSEAPIYTDELPGTRTAWNPDSNEFMEVEPRVDDDALFSLLTRVAQASTDVADAQDLHLDEAPGSGTGDGEDADADADAGGADGKHGDGCQFGTVFADVVQVPVVTLPAKDPTASNPKCVMLGSKHAVHDTNGSVNLLVKLVWSKRRSKRLTATASSVSIGDDKLALCLDDSALVQLARVLAPGSHLPSPADCSHGQQLQLLKVIVEHLRIVLLGRKTTRLLLASRPAAVHVAAAASDDGDDDYRHDSERGYNKQQEQVATQRSSYKTSGSSSSNSRSEQKQELPAGAGAGATMPHWKFDDHVAMESVHAKPAAARGGNDDRDPALGNAPHVGRLEVTWDSSPDSKWRVVVLSTFQDPVQQAGARFDDAWMHAFMLKHKQYQAAGVSVPEPGNLSHSLANAPHAFRAILIKFLFTRLRVHTDAKTGHRSIVVI